MGFSSPQVYLYGALIDLAVADRVTTTELNMNSGIFYLAFTCTFVLNGIVTACCSCGDEINEVEKNILDAIKNLEPQGPTSCAEIKKKHPSTKSSQQEIINSAGEKKHVYCNMENIPGCGDGGWTRIANYDRRAGTTCPPGFVDYQNSGKVACNPTTNGVGCQSVIIPADHKYTRVCGRVQGYQFRSGDAFRRYSAAGKLNDINTAYLDGISITKGYPRQHLWSYVASQGSHPHIVCPCAVPRNAATTPPPSFVKNDYYCEGGGAKRGVQNILWDGKDCSAAEQKGCCETSNPNMPWFHRELTVSSSDFVELRVCSDESLGNEMFPFFQYEFYIQ